MHLFEPFGIAPWFILAFLGNLLFWGAIILLVCFLIKNFSGSNRSGQYSPPLDRSTQASRGESPEDVARRRLAAGEISEDEYDRIMAKLRE